MVGHTLLIETPRSLVLVDAGLGTKDIETPKRRMGINRHFIRFDLDLSNTALEHVKRLGFSPTDVQDILLTHLDFDHAGGISDFPHAKIHLFGPEFVAAMAPMNFIERLRYRKIQWSHSPKWAIEKISGDPWFGFEAVSQIKGLPPEIMMVPLIGHTLGHSGVAVKNGDRWLLHAGDAYYHRSQLANQRIPNSILLFEKLVQLDPESRQESLERIKDLIKNPANPIDVFCSHDPHEFQAMSLKRSAPHPIS